MVVSDLKGDGPIGAEIGVGPVEQPEAHDEEDDAGGECNGTERMAIIAALATTITALAIHMTVILAPGHHDKMLP